MYSRGSQQVSALRDISLEVPSGEFHVVMGPSGSGKSTLLHLLATLDLPTSGTVWLNGQSTTTCTDAQLSRIRRDHIGLVFQSFHLLPYLTVRENIALPRLLQRVPPNRVAADTDSWLDAVGLRNRENHRPHELSGGEAQRTAIARALITQPRLLLADEPTGNLDSSRGRDILALVKHLTAEKGITTVLVTHDADAAACGHRVTHLRDGAVVT